MTEKAVNREGEGGRPVPLLNIANVLTAVRLAMVPVFVAIVVISGMSRPSWQVFSCALFCVAAATDYADGRIARSRNLVTSFGKIADPIADKALIGSALILLSLYDRLPWWVTATILVREIGVTLLRFWVIRRAVIAASKGGKVKTALQVVAIAWCLAPLPSPLDHLGWWIAVAAMVITVVTGLDYLGQAVRVRRAPVARPATAEKPDNSVPIAREEAA